MLLTPYANAKGMQGQSQTVQSMKQDRCDQNHLAKLDHGGMRKRNELIVGPGSLRKFVQYDQVQTQVKRQPQAREPVQDECPRTGIPVARVKPARCLSG